MNQPFKLGFRCADGLLPAIEAMPNREYLLHVLKGMALTCEGFRRAKGYQVNGRTRFAWGAL